jgi:hypothetical protein
MPWRRFLACGLVTLSAAVLLGSIYVAATGRITNKLSAIETLKNLFDWITRILGASETQGAGTGSAFLFGASFPLTDSRWIRFQRSAWALVSEINQGFHYVAGIVALFGCVMSFSRLRGQVGYWFLAVFVLLHSLVLIALAMSVGYVSDRHVMILVLIGSFFVVVGLHELPRLAFGWRKADDTTDEAANRITRWASSPKVWFALLLAGLFIFCLPKATQRLHGNRLANHAAGLWLADHLQDGDIILDDHAWSHFFSGSVFREGFEPMLPRDMQPNCYVVMTRSRDPLIDEKRQEGVLDKDAKVVWPAADQVERARVVIYLQPRDERKNPWRKGGD